MKRIVFVATIVALVGCGSGSSVDDHIADVSELNTSVLHLNEIEMEPLIGHPDQLRMLGDTLILGDKVSDKALMLYDLRNNQYRRCLNIGNGPDDVTFPVSLDVNLEKHEVAILQRRTGIVRSYRLPDLWDEAPRQILSMRVTGSDKFALCDSSLFIAGYNTDPMIQQKNQTGNTIGSVDYGMENTISEIKSGGAMSIKSTYILQQADFTYNEYSQTLMVAPAFAPTIYFYKQRGSNWVKEDSLSIGRNDFTERIRQGDFSVKNSDTQGSMDICKTKHFFYELYDGSPMGDRESNGMYILKFTAEGKFDKAYRVNQGILTFCVNEDDTELYAVVRGETDDYAIAKAMLE